MFFRQRINLALVFGLMVACPMAAHADSEAGSESGGFFASGGSSESGGVFATGASTESGGYFYSGGSTESGGVYNSGGYTESGGYYNSGGSSESGGVYGTGAYSESGFSPVVRRRSYVWRPYYQQPYSPPTIAQHVPELEIKNYSWPATTVAVQQSSQPANVGGIRVTPDATPHTSQWLRYKGATALRETKPAHQKSIN